MPTDYNTQENVDKLQRIFATWDKSGDGEISKSELKIALVKLGMKSPDVEKIFNDMDFNKDGRIIYSEFVRWLKLGDAVASNVDPTKKTTSPDVAAEKIWDILQQKKLETMKDAKGNESDIKDKDLFMFIDANGNGEVGISEFIAGLRHLQVDGTYPISENDYTDGLLHEVFDLIDQAKKKWNKLTGKKEDVKDHALTWKEFQKFMAEK
eukprot:CAMPEP_0197638108 /NCGR_PEP_ID=MMETSP1338-20131121/13129_1 /TAXON_ID=43686 ORGANISM="Pelagodinium beii, Strain RCC1491" /NCGR_SAMPLE_ID=MMETSP1338 /ASSEMBLY_ACC=CAM_ASM_000754 /LENGTH=208 /DNA_ID=CAMNT_0043210629 /DNA_START=26 /DNA_END=652 /DNA_ORIENTATION=+